MRALAAPTPRARGGERPAAGRRRRDGGGTPLGGGGAGAGPGWSPPRRRRWAAGHRAKLWPEGVFPSGLALRERDATAKWRPRARGCAQRNGGSAGCPDGVAQGVRGAHARGGGRGHDAWPGPPLPVSRWSRARAAQTRCPPSSPSEGPRGAVHRTFWPVSGATWRGFSQPVKSRSKLASAPHVAPRGRPRPPPLPRPSAQPPSPHRRPTVDQALCHSPPRWSGWELGPCSQRVTMEAHAFFGCPVLDVLCGPQLGWSCGVPQPGQP